MRSLLPAAWKQMPVITKSRRENPQIASGSKDVWPLSGRGKAWAPGALVSCLHISTRSLSGGTQRVHCSLAEWTSHCIRGCNDKTELDTHWGQIPGAGCQADISWERESVFTSCVSLRPFPHSGIKPTTKWFYPTWRDLVMSDHTTMYNSPEREVWWTPMLGTTHDHNASLKAGVLLEKPRLIQLVCFEDTLIMGSRQATASSITRGLTEPRGCYQGLYNAGCCWDRYSCLLSFDGLLKFEILSTSCIFRLLCCKMFWRWGWDTCTVCDCI